MPRATTQNLGACLTFEKVPYTPYIREVEIPTLGSLLPGCLYSFFMLGVC